MTIKKRGLGRGLEALLANVSTTEEKHQLQTLPINTLQKSIHLSPDDMNSDELTNAVTMPDTLEPVVVRKIADNNDEMGAGEKTWRAARLAGLQEVPAIIKERDDREATAIALIETIQKENLKLVQEAEDLRKLIDEFEAMVRRL
jgi:ParB family transcriptional regulator, chromosome partitioning protein